MSVTSEAASLIGACAPVPPRTPREVLRPAARASNADLSAEVSEFEDSDDGESMQEIRVNSLSGRVCTVTLDGSGNVVSLKKAIQAATGMQVCSQRLIAGTCELYDSDPLPRNVLGGGPIEVALIKRTPQETEWLAAVTKCWTRFLSAPHEMRADFEVALRAVEQKGSLLHYASQELRADRRLVLAAMRSDGNALQYASELLRNDPEVVLEAVQADGRALGYSGPAMRSDREVVFAAVLCQPSALQYADEQLRDDRDLALLAVRKDGASLRYVGHIMRRDVEVVVAAIHNRHKAFRYCGREARLHPEVLRAMGMDLEDC